ncbi:MAG TPA: GIY-YIG nuclease family protein [Polyangiaceae bacterium]
MDAWFVYIARCTDGTLYAGIARDVAARVAQHDAGKGARYTRGRGPLTVLAKRRCPSKGDALRLEAAVKRLSKAEKVRIAASRRRMAALANTLGRAAPCADRGSSPRSRATPAP